MERLDKRSTFKETYILDDLRLRRPAFRRRTFKQTCVESGNHEDVFSFCWFVGHVERFIFRWEREPSIKVAGFKHRVARRQWVAAA